MLPTFVHLRVHSEFSLVDGLIQLKPLMQQLIAFNQPAVAITEQNNLFSLVKFYKAATASGIKPIIGADVLILNSEEFTQPFRLTLLVHNQQGYISLTELISKAYQQGQKNGIPLLDRVWLENHTQGLIALSGAMEGDIGRALISGKNAIAEAYCQQWQRLFPNRFYLELQRIGKANEESYITAALSLAERYQLPVVATNNVRFLYAENFIAHEVRVCIHQGRILEDNRRPKDYTNQQYLRSSEEMSRLFADIPEAIQNTVEIAKRCTLQLTLGQNVLPDFPVPNTYQLNDYFREQAKIGLAYRLQHYPPVKPYSEAMYWQRLEIELTVICQMGFAGYFLIVADFIQWAKNQQIPVGPGRGSGAGSLVAYVLKITDLDPIYFELLFERFLNPERISMPDFDIDFCMDRRDEVIEYVAQRYGRDRVSQIITHGSMAAKAVIRDVGRVLNYSYGFVDKLAKLIPFEIGITLEKALADNSELNHLYQNDNDVKTLFDTALSLEGLARNAGKHAGGVVIAPSKLTDFTPLYCEEDGSNLVTQFDKNDVEAVGLVKFDFLGLRTLTIIDWAVQTINQQQKKLGLPAIDIAHISLNDAKTYELLKSSQTTAVFQLESDGIKKLIYKLQPDCFDDIVALVALYRPGPLESGMVDDYVNVKHKRQAAEYPHPLLESILKTTNGVILYQEQVMQIARELSGYTLGGADILRRAMGKKDVQEMAKQRDAFVQGAIANQVSAETANYIFDLIDKFAGYGFNRSHSAAYALVAYQTAWLKAHYPAAFMAAVLSSDMDNTDKIVGLIEECKQLKLTICPPNIHLSDYRFTVNDQKQIVYGLGAIKGIGQAAIEDLMLERKQNGIFTGLYNLCQRVVKRKLTRRVLETLIKSGSFDCLNPNRWLYLAELPNAIQAAEQQEKAIEMGQNDFFGQITEKSLTNTEPKYSAVAKPWTMLEQLEAEKSVLGFYLTGHPLTEYIQEFNRLIRENIRQLTTKIESSKNKIDCLIIGLVQELKHQPEKNRCFL
ncbi:MAG: hypothetical protein RL637_1319, partial [Pseudomonadota bacterium]